MTKVTIKHIFANISPILDSLRSTLGKNAVLTLADLFVYLEHGKIQDEDIANSYTKLIKKTADTNVFIAGEADIALQKMCFNTQFMKSISFFHKFYDNKSLTLKKAVSKCLEIIMSNIGSKNIVILP